MLPKILKIRKTLLKSFHDAITILRDYNQKKILQETTAHYPP